MLSVHLGHLCRARSWIVVTSAFTICNSDSLVFCILDTDNVARTRHKGWGKPWFLPHMNEEFSCGQSSLGKSRVYEVGRPSCYSGQEEKRVFKKDLKLWWRWSLLRIILFSGEKKLRTAANNQRVEMKLKTLRKM